MDNQALKKYSPLGLLALAIVAGVAAVSTHTPPSKDAGFDVIGYFYCESDEASNLEFALIREGNSFGYLFYQERDQDIIDKGEPTDLTYFSQMPIKNPVITRSHYEWEFNGNYKLRRDNGRLTKQHSRGPNLPGCKGIECFQRYTDYFSWECRYGEEGEKWFWDTTLYDYEKRHSKF